MTARTQTTEDPLRSFWEMKAKRYPLPFDRKSLKKTERVISLVKEKGVAIQGIHPDRNRLREFLTDHARDGVVRHVTFAEEGVVVWQPE